MYSKDILNFVSSKSVPRLNSQQQGNEDITDIFGKQSQLAKPVEIYFKFVYYICGSPFKLVRDSEGTGYYYKKVWRPQQGICAFLHILCIFRLVSQIREVIPNNNSRLLKNPSPYFDLVLECAAFLFKTVTMKRFWFNGGAYMKTLNTILKGKHLPVRNKWTIKPGFLYLLYGFFVLKIIARLTSGTTFVIPVSKWSPSWWFRRLVDQSRYVFLFYQQSKPTEAPELESITFWDGLLAFIMLLTQFERCVLSEFADLCLLSFSLTLWTAANCFARDINDRLQATENDDELSINGATSQNQINVQVRINNREDTEEKFWERIYQSFQAIQYLSEKVNVAMGTQVIWYLAEGLMYYSIHMNVLFITKDNFKRVNSFIFFVLTFIILYISADICNQMATVKAWLVKKDNIRYVPTEQASLVLHEVITKDIGIRGNNAFTITFGMVAGYLSLIVTFFVICVQESDLKMA